MLLMDCGFQNTIVKELIHKTDKYRMDYYKYYTSGENGRDALNYDLMENGLKQTEIIV